MFACRITNANYRNTCKGSSISFKVECRTRDANGLPCICQITAAFKLILLSHGFHQQGALVCRFFLSQKIPDLSGLICH